MVKIPAEFEELKFYTEAEQFIEQFGEAATIVLTKTIASILRVH